MSPSTTESVRRAPSDETRAEFEQEALVHLDALFRVAMRFAGNASDADDLVQETLFKAFQAWHQYEKGTNAKAWLLTILRNVFIEEYRRTARREALSLHALEPSALVGRVSGDDPEESYFDNLVDDEVTRAIDTLPYQLREIVALRDIEGLRYEEIAAMLRVPVGTVKSRLFRARGILKAALYDYAVSTGLIRGQRAQRKVSGA